MIYTVGTEEEEEVEVVVEAIAVEVIVGTGMVIEGVEAEAIAAIEEDTV